MEPSHDKFEVDKIDWTTYSGCQTHSRCPYLLYFKLLNSNTETELKVVNLNLFFMAKKSEKMNYVLKAI